LLLLFVQLVAALKALHPAGGIYDALLASEERMTFAAELHPQRFPGGTGGEGIAAGARDLGIRIVFGMNFLSHGYSDKTLTFLMVLVNGPYFTMPVTMAKRVWSLPTPTLIPG
jgi:hypothetical protein